MQYEFKKGPIYRIIIFNVFPFFHTQTLPDLTDHNIQDLDLINVISFMLFNVQMSLRICEKSEHITEMFPSNDLWFFSFSNEIKFLS